MGDLVDPLKFHTFGVKKALENKQDKIQLLEDANRRYYPTDQKGNIDEWGAVIKRQSETFERQQQEEALAQQHKIKQYGDDLKKELLNRGQRGKIKLLEKEFDREQLQKEKQMRDLVEQEQREQERAQRYMFGEQIKSAIDIKNQEQLQEKVLESQQDYQQIQKLQREQQLKSMEEAERKQAQRLLMSQDLEHSRMLKKMKDEKERELQLREEQRQAQFDYFSKHDQRGALQKKRFNQFDEDQKRVHDSYNRLVAQPKVQKSMQQLEKEQRDEREMLARQAEQAQREEQQKKQTLQMNYQLLQKQLNNNMHRQPNNNGTLPQVYDQKSEHDQLMEQKREQQRQYRALLDDQMQKRQQMKIYGNMSSVEKNLNREDLNAWKNYDNNQYSLIPGVTASKKVVDHSQNPKMTHFSPTKGRYQDPKFFEKQERLRQYGYNVGPRDFTGSLDRSVGVNSSINIGKYGQASNALQMNNQQMGGLSRGLKRQSQTVEHSLDRSGFQDALEQGIDQQNHIDNANIQVALQGSNQYPTQINQIQGSPYQSNNISQQDLHNANSYPAGQRRSLAQSNQRQHRSGVLYNAGSNILR